MNKLIVAYHGNLYFDTFVQHVQEIKAKGFNTILFCITETDLRFNLETFQEFREHAQKEGLKCWATFWGLTAGEAITTFDDKEDAINKWLIAVKNIGFHNIFIDEPKTLKDIYFFTDNDLFDFHLCLTDDGFNKMSDQQIKELPVKSVGVSCYHWIRDWLKIAVRTEIIALRLHKLRPENNFLFIQGFDIPEGMEELPTKVKAIAQVNYINDFGFWSFRCTAATACKRPVNYKSIWKDLKW